MLQCSMNPYKMGHPEYYGLDLEVDTSRPFTVVTRKQPSRTYETISLQKRLLFVINATTPSSGCRLRDKQQPYFALLVSTFE